MTYRSDAGSPDDLLAAVEGAGYEPRLIVTSPTPGAAAHQLAPDALPPKHRERFAEAGRLLLLAFEGPG